MTVHQKERVLYGAEARLVTGRVELVRMGAMREQDDGRFGFSFAGKGEGNPEALLAAAQASCYAGSLASALGRLGSPVEALTIRTVCELEREPEGAEDLGWHVAAVRVEVAADGDGISREALDLADRVCPISKVISRAVPVLTAAR